MNQICVVRCPKCKGIVAMTVMPIPEDMLRAMDNYKRKRFIVMSEAADRPRKWCEDSCDQKPITQPILL